MLNQLAHRVIGYLGICLCTAPKRDENNIRDKVVILHTLHIILQLYPCRVGDELLLPYNFEIALGLVFS